MGVLLNMDLDTNLGSSKKVYFRIENINLNRTFGRVRVAVTYWFDQDHSEQHKHSHDRNPDGLIDNTVILFENEDDIGAELNLPTLFEFDLTRPNKVMIPILEEQEVSDTVPYISFDELGRKTVKTREIKKKVMVKVGEREDITQVLDFNLENNLIPWCYGQIKAALADILPVDQLEDC